MSYKHLTLSAVILLLCISALSAKDRPEPEFKRDSMLVMPEALKRVPVQLQVSAWAVFYEMTSRGFVVDPTLAMVSGVRNPFCVREMSVVITKGDSRIEFYVDSLCAGPSDTSASAMATLDSIEYADNWDTLASNPLDMRVRVISSSIKPTKLHWPQTMPLDSASIRAIYRIILTDKGDLGFHELFGSFDAEELLTCDSTRKVMLR